MSSIPVKRSVAGYHFSMTLTLCQLSRSARPLCSEMECRRAALSESRQLNRVVRSLTPRGPISWCTLAALMGESPLGWDPRTASAGVCRPTQRASCFKKAPTAVVGLRSGRQEQHVWRESRQRQLCVLGAGMQLRWLPCVLRYRNRNGRVTTRYAGVPHGNLAFDQEGSHPGSM